MFGGRAWRSLDYCMRPLHITCCTAPHHPSCMPAVSCTATSPHALHPLLIGGTTHSTTCHYIGRGYTYSFLLSFIHFYLCWNQRANGSDRFVHLRIIRLYSYREGQVTRRRRPPCRQRTSTRRSAQQEVGPKSKTRQKPRPGRTNERTDCHHLVISLSLLHSSALAVRFDPHRHGRRRDVLPLAGIRFD